MSNGLVEIISPNNVLANAMLRSVDMVRPRLQATNPDRVAFCVAPRSTGRLTWVPPWCRPLRSCSPRPPSAPSTSTPSYGRRPRQRPSRRALGPRNPPRLPQTYHHALGAPAVNDLIEKYYRGLFDSLADATGVDYEIETYSAQQADPVFRHEFLATLGRLEAIRWPLAPSTARSTCVFPARSADGPRNAPSVRDCSAPDRAAPTSPPCAPITATTRWR